MERMMRIRNGHDGLHAVQDNGEDRDLIAMVNEARDPAEIDQIVSMARQRRRARRQAAAAAAAAERRPSRRGAHLFGRSLSFRH
jgi:hypothetical protein